MLSHSTKASPYHNHSVPMGEKTKMETLKEHAQAYEPPQTLNVTALDKVPVNAELKDGTGTDKNGEAFTYKYITVDEKNYRVPVSVIGGIKAVLKRNPSIQYVTVDKDGEGKNTKYTTLPYMEVSQETVQ